MNKSKYKVYNGSKIKGFFEKTNIFFFLIIISVGMTVGAFSAGKSEMMKNIAVQYLQFRKASGFSELLFRSAFVNVSFIILSAFLGFSLIGSPEIYCLLFIRGLGTGALCGYLYAEYGISGVGYSVLTMLPSMLVFIYSLMMSSKDSIEYSQNAYLKAIKGRGHFENGETRIFLIRQFIYIIIAMFGSVIDSLFSLLFSRFFSV